MKRRRVETESDADGGVVVRHGAAVYFHAEVTKATVLELLREVREASAHAMREAHPMRTPEVTLYIHSGGGDAHAGLSAMDHLQSNPVPVTTVADGMVASAASFLLLAGTKRVAFPHSFVLIHQLSIGGFEGKYADMQDEMQNTSAVMDALRRIYRERTAMTPKRIDRFLKKELAMDAPQCLKEGFVHEIFGT